MESRGVMDVEYVVNRNVELKNEGRGLGKDMTMLLLEVRHLARRMTRMERSLADLGAPPMSPTS